MTPPVKKVRVVEVGPRDGLQNQGEIIPVHLKLEWIEHLSACGLPEIEVTSFVNPRWVPQLADAIELAQRLPQGGSIYSALVPNLHGLEDALSAGVRNIAVFTATSETFNQKNINCSVAESLQRFEKIFQRLQGESVRVRGYLSTCFGCPYEGEVPAAEVARLAKELQGLGCAEIAVSDTIGVATPRQVQEVVEKVAEQIPVTKLALHFHDTRGMALVNVMAGLDLGVTTYDASSGGLGGCPFAPGATGNLASEDLVFLLDSLGIETGIDLDALAATNLKFERHFPQPFPGRVLGSYRDK
ncbi:MAG: hydroxymethylglutaryl-CoA lyase [Planctomycetota bacterium]